MPICRKDFDRRSATTAEDALASHPFVFRVRDWNVYNIWSFGILGSTSIRHLLEEL